MPGGRGRGGEGALGPWHLSDGLDALPEAEEDDDPGDEHAHDQFPDERPAFRDSVADFQHVLAES